MRVSVPPRSLTRVESGQTSSEPRRFWREVTSAGALSAAVARLPEQQPVAETVPFILVVNRQRRVRLPLEDLQRFAEQALERVLASPGALLPPEINVALVSDRKICELHRDFMQLRTATDVITFQHGEIVLSVDTAGRQAAEYGTCLVRELKLYLLHGLLHLRGYDDRTTETRREITALQTCLLAELIRDGAAPP